jgi:hypothetical protein
MAGSRSAGKSQQHLLRHDPHGRPRTRLTLKEAANYLGINYSNIRFLTTGAGLRNLPVVRIRKRVVRLRPEALAQWLKEQESAGRRGVPFALYARSIPRLKARLWLRTTLLITWG